MRVIIFSISSRYVCSLRYWSSSKSHGIAPLKTPSVNTPDAVDQERQGTNTRGLGQLVAAREAICRENMVKS